MKNSQPPSTIVAEHNGVLYVFIRNPDGTYTQLPVQQNTTSSSSQVSSTPVETLTPPAPQLLSWAEEESDDEEKKDTYSSRVRIHEKNEKPTSSSSPVNLVRRQRASREGETREGAFRSYFQEGKMFLRNLIVSFLKSEGDVFYSESVRGDPFQYTRSTKWHAFLCFTEDGSYIFINKKKYQMNSMLSLWQDIANDLGFWVGIHNDQENKTRCVHITWDRRCEEPFTEEDVEKYFDALTFETMVEEYMEEFEEKA